MKHVSSVLDGRPHALDQAADFVGGRAVLAGALGVKLAALGNWKVRGVPVERCVPIEAATAGAVTRKDLRPSDWAEIWPEAARADWRPVGATEPATAGQG